ncbi:hypothetical protein GW7_04642 [Heterocephalus glaber]|uniref:Uncharacterized protein n=1 Tax=Heterocephalus glaber TaxID=10181 RepID=G5BGP8_HETGA|nr:hypothetical protein GW7_04642 [Heterocephalus glaber]
MGCASAKHVATVQNEEEAQKGKNYQNGDVFGEYFEKDRGGFVPELGFKPHFKEPVGFKFKVMGVRGSGHGVSWLATSHLRKWHVGLWMGTWATGLTCMRGVFFDLDNTFTDTARASWKGMSEEKSASSNVRLKTNKEIPGLVHQPRANMHISESQQEFFRMLDEKIEKKKKKEKEKEKEEKKGEEKEEEEKGEEKVKEKEEKKGEGGRGGGGEREGEE